MKDEIDYDKINDAQVAFMMMLYHNPAKVDQSRYDYDILFKEMKRMLTSAYSIVEKRVVSREKRGSVLTYDYTIDIVHKMNKNSMSIGLMNIPLRKTTTNVHQILGMEHRAQRELFYTVIMSGLNAIYEKLK